jgi:HSP20 family protein
MAVTLRRPYGTHELPGLRALNRVFDEAFATWPFDAAPTSWIPACDITEGPEGLRLALDIPGVDPQNVKISLENRVLTIRGEKARKVDEKTEQGHRFERSFGSFERTFTLPDTLETEKVQASSENGVLTLVIPKAEKAKPREIPVVVK